MKKLMIRFVTLVLLGFSQIAASQTAWITEVTVQRTLLDNVNFGGCMIYQSQILAESGLNCPGKWVTFSCDGTFSSKEMAFRKMDQAQIALALNKKISLQVDDSKKHNGYCFARRIDLLN